jgi:hypothetical protein
LEQAPSKDDEKHSRKEERKRKEKEQRLRQVYVGLQLLVYEALSY